MAVKAYVLMNLIAEDLSETLKAVKEIKNVNFADAVTGPYDAIVQLEAPDMDELGRLITTKILKIKGVAKTLTCVAV
jgi:DNA-binding Lrp family transcriptional regulator